MSHDLEEKPLRGRRSAVTRVEKPRAVDVDYASGQLSPPAHPRHVVPDEKPHPLDGHNFYWLVAAVVRGELPHGEWCLSKHRKQELASGNRNVNRDFLAVEIDH